MSGQAAIVPDVRRIAVLKAGGLGDLLFAFPALDALRAAYPHAEVTLLTSAVGVGLLRGRPSAVDRVLAVPPFEDDAARTADARHRLEAFCADFRAQRFDLALQMHGGGANSNPLLARLGARLTAGLRAPGAPPLDRTIPYVYFQSEVARCLEVASAVGAASVASEPRLTVTPADGEAAQAALPADAHPLAVIHPGAGDGRRRWPPRKFAAVGRQMQEVGARIAVIGTAPERGLAAEVASAVPGAVDLCGELTMPALVGLLGRASVVVTNDSGPLHLANAVGARTVSVFWCGNLINAGPATVSGHRTLASWRLGCPVCGADCMAEGCGHDASFVADVASGDVPAAALELLTAPEGDARHAAGPLAPVSLYAL